MSSKCLISKHNFYSVAIELCKKNAIIDLIVELANRWLPEVAEREAFT